MTQPQLSNAEPPQARTEPRATSPRSGSGNAKFDTFQEALSRDTHLREELESALRVNVDRVNPSDPGNRFITGGAAEWIIAAAAWDAGVLVIPGGHSVRGFDLMDLQEAARGLWSVKSQTAKKPGAFRISNGLGGAGKGMTDPTLFLSPHLPGLVLVDPELHPEVVAEEKRTRKKDTETGESVETDAVTLAFGIVKRHARLHPECVVPLRVPQNEGRGTENPFLEYTQTILEPRQFPRLSGMFKASKPQTGTLAQDLQDLNALHASGALTDEEFAAAKGAAIRNAT